MPPPAVAEAAAPPHPTLQNPSRPQNQHQGPASAAMGNPHPGSDQSAAPLPPPTRRPPRLAKRRHAAASTRSRQPPPASSPAAAAPWNPFVVGGGGTDGTGEPGVGGVGFVFSSAAAPATSQQPQQPPAASSGESPFVFGSVRDSLPRFDEGWSASTKLPEKMGKMNIRTPGHKSSINVSKDRSSIFGVDIPSLVSNSEANVLPEKLTQLNIGSRAPLQSDRDDVPKAFVFGGNASGPDSSTKENGVPEKLAQFGVGNQTPSGRMGSESTKGAPPVFVFRGNTSDHVDSANDVSSGANGNPSDTFNSADGAALLPGRIAQLSTGSSIPIQQMKSGGSSGQAEAFVFGSSRTANTIIGLATENTSDAGSVFFSAANSDASVPPSSANNLPPELASWLNVGGGVTQSKQNDNSGCPSEVFVFGTNASTGSQSSKEVMDDDGNFVTGANLNTFTSIHGNVEGTLPEKMTKLNIGHGTPSDSNKGETACQPPEVYAFGSNTATTSTTYSSVHAAHMPFRSIQTNVSFELKGNGGNLANEGIGKFAHSRSNNYQGYGTSNFVFSSGSNAVPRTEESAEHGLQDEVRKLNINMEGPSVGCTEVNESSTQFVFRSKAEVTPVFGAVPQSNVQESRLFTHSNHSPSFSTSGNEMPSFSFRTTDTGSDTIPGESCAVRQDTSWCSRESLFGIDYIKSAYRDKKEAHKTARKNKNSTKLKQRAHIHQFASQETCTTGPDMEFAGDYSPMDCSPYPATVEQASREASVTSDQSVHMHDSGVSNQNSSHAEELVSATEHLVIDADLPTCEEEGRLPNVDTSGNSFASSFSSFDEEVNIHNASRPFSNMNVAANGKPKSAPAEVWGDAYGHNDQGQAHEENDYRTVHDFGEHVPSQSSSADFNGLNFSFGASLTPQSSLSTQRRNTRRKLRTKGGHSSKPSTTQASVQPNSSLDKMAMQFSPETNETADSTNEQATRDASISAALESCESWRTSGNQAYANGHFATAEEYYTRGINSISNHGSSGCSSRALMLCYSNRAATKMSLGRMRDALQDCVVATSIDPTFLKAKVRAANCQLALGDLEDAARSYKTCLKSSKTGSDIKMFSEASDGLERVQRVADWILQSKELLKKRTASEATMALELISNALRISSHSDKLMEMKAEALLTLRKYEEVIQLCQETVVLAEKNSSASETTECSGRLWRTYLICKTYFLSGKLEDALELLNKHQQVTNVKESDGRTSQECFSSLSTTIRELLSHKAAGNEAFQARRYSEAVEQYSAALACNSDSHPFAAVCFCNRAAAYQALGQITDAVADCSLAMVLDATYPKAISRRATLYEMIRDYGQAANDLRKLISLLEKANKPGLSPKVPNKHSDLKQARARLSSVEDEAKRDTPLNLYLILGIEQSSSPADVKKAYRKAALRHHPDKAAQLLVRNEKPDDGFWRDVAKEVYADADHLFKAIGEAYNVLSDSDKRQEYDIEENLRNASKRVSKGRSMHRSPEQRKGFNPRQWQSNRSSGSRSCWSAYHDDYW